MRGDDALWREIAARHGLAEPDLRRLASPWHTDLDLGRPIEVMTDMKNSRERGFGVFQSTEQSFLDLFTQLRGQSRLAQAISKAGNVLRTSIGLKSHPTSNGEGRLDPTHILRCNSGFVHAAHLRACSGQPHLERPPVRGRTHTAAQHLSSLFILLHQIESVAKMGRAVPRYRRDHGSSPPGYTQSRRAALPALASTLP